MSSNVFASNVFYAGNVFVSRNVGIGTFNPATALDVFTGTMNAATVVATSITALTDAIAQGPYLTPSTSNAATIFQWMTKTTRTIAVSAGVPPFWSNATSTNSFNTVTGTTNPGGANAYQGGVLLPDGRVVFCPFSATNVGIFNPATNQFSTVTGTTNPGGSSAYVGGVLLPDGRVVFVPYSATNVGMLSGSVPAPREFCLSPYYNKF